MPSDEPLRNRRITCQTRTYMYDRESGQHENSHGYFTDRRHYLPDHALSYAQTPDQKFSERSFSSGSASSHSVNKPAYVRVRRQRRRSVSIYTDCQPISNNGDKTKQSTTPRTAKRLAYAKKDGKPGTRGYRINLFPEMSAEERNGLQIDEVGRYCVTDSRSADKTARLIEILLGKPANECAVTDACCSIGGSTFGFARRFGYCTAIEMDIERYEKLRTNLGVLNLSPHVTALHGSYLQARHYVWQDCTFFDPPWGGVAYHKEKSISLSLGGVDVAQLCNEAKSALCVVKIPFNFDRDAFLERVRPHSTNVCEVKVRNYALLCVRYGGDSNEDLADLLLDSGEFKRERMHSLTQIAPVGSLASRFSSTSTLSSVKRETALASTKSQIHSSPNLSNPSSRFNSTSPAETTFCGTTCTCGQQTRASNSDGFQLQQAHSTLCTKDVPTKAEPKSSQACTSQPAPLDYAFDTENRDPLAPQPLYLVGKIAGRSVLGDFVVISPAERKRQTKKGKDSKKKKGRRASCDGKGDSVKKNVQTLSKVPLTPNTTLVNTSLTKLAANSQFLPFSLVSKGPKAGFLRETTPSSFLDTAKIQNSSAKTHSRSLLPSNITNLSSHVSFGHNISTPLKSGKKTLDDPLIRRFLSASARKPTKTVPEDAPRPLSSTTKNSLEFPRTPANTGSSKRFSRPSSIDRSRFG